MTTIVFIKALIEIITTRVLVLVRQAAIVLVIATGNF